MLTHASRHHISLASIISSKVDVTMYIAVVGAEPKPSSNMIVSLPKILVILTFPVWLRGSHCGCVVRSLCDLDKAEAKLCS